MRWIFLIAMLGPVAVAAQIVPDDDAILFHQALSHDAFNEMRCRGLSADRTKRLYNQLYKTRQDRIRSAMSLAYGPRYLNDEDIIPIGRQCSHYKGAEKRLQQALSDAETRLNMENR